jgi:hypothetical protein
VEGRHIAERSRALVARLSRRTLVPRLGAGVFALGGATRAVTDAAAQATPQASEESAGYLVIRRFRLKEGADYPELTRRIAEGFVPLIREVPGFIEYLTAEPGDGTHVAVSIFADQTGAEESTARAGSWAAENVAEFVELPAYEIISAPVRLDARGQAAA